MSYIEEYIIIIPLAVSLAVLSAVIASVVIRFILRTKLVNLFADAPDHRKVHAAPIPRVGGIAIIAAMLVVTLIWYVIPLKIGSALDIARLPDDLFFCILAAAISLGVLGFLDDTRLVDVRVRHKLAVIFGLALISVYLFHAHPGAINVFNIFEIPEFWGKIIAVLWIVGLINAYNLVDGLDGFAGVITIVSLLGIMAVSLLIFVKEQPADPAVVTLSALSLFAVGAVAGFMVHNAPPARVFMGDTGSCFLGYMIALLTIHAASLMGKSEEFASAAVPAVMPLLAAMPILEVFVTIVRRFISANEQGIRKTLKYIVTADSLHIHHRFLFRGFSHLETCILVGVMTATLAGGAVCIVLAPIQYMPWIAAYLAIPVAVSLYRLGFGRQVRQQLRRQSVKLRENLGIDP